MGVQTFNPQLLELLGRTHAPEDIYQAIDNARQVGIESISLDLMYHLPQQSLDDFKESLDIALSLNIDHISSYGLILEPQTQFYNMYRKGKLKLPSEDVGEEMYTYLIERLNQTSFHQYEISNFAKKDMNLNIIKYIGKTRDTTVSALVPVVMLMVSVIPMLILSIITLKDSSGERPVLHSTRPTIQEQMEEEMFLGLRMNKGVSIKRFEEKFDQSIDQIYGQTLNQLVSDGLIEINDGFISLTERGKVIGNEVFEAFLLSV